MCSYFEQYRPDHRLYGFLPELRIDLRSLESADSEAKFDRKEDSLSDSALARVTASDSKNNSLTNSESNMEISAEVSIEKTRTEKGKDSEAIDILKLYFPEEKELVSAFLEHVDLGGLLTDIVKYSVMSGEI